MAHVQLWPNDISLGSFEVISSQIRFFIACNLWLNWHRALGMVPIYYLCRNAWYWGWPTWVTMWPWALNLNLSSNFDLDLNVLSMHIFWRILTKGTRWYPDYVTSFLSSKVSWKKRNKSRASVCFCPQPAACYSFWDNDAFSKTYCISLNLTMPASGDLKIDLNGKIIVILSNVLMESNQTLLCVFLPSYFLS